MAVTGAQAPLGAAYARHRLRIRSGRKVQAKAAGALRANCYASRRRQAEANAGCRRGDAFAWHSGPPSIRVRRAFVDGKWRWRRNRRRIRRRPRPPVPAPASMRCAPRSPDKGASRQPESEWNRTWVWPPNA
ncbi:conserved protein of unknown function [Paraburkholderia dioscoreae]|uniref:Uncharacterized protein n=1 Tax=Paraburkholderia dioscoreae TaxID=2604047 RepID=A0A5Q4ZLE2_9BURK|nr:conserved protein of unknown function [Paraburkholderia dioscoreae]